MKPIHHIIADALNASPEQVQTAIKLLDQGATVPFIARYRKPQTQGLTDIQLRELHTQLAYLRQLEDRRQIILKNLQEQNQLTPERKQALLHCHSKTALEDIYRPFKPKKTRISQAAQEAGLESAAQDLLTLKDQTLTQLTAPFLNKHADFSTHERILEGCESIIAEQISHAPEVLQGLRQTYQKYGMLYAKQHSEPNKTKSAAKYLDYANHQESVSKAPSHRIMAMLRGRQEGCLKLSISLDEKQTRQLIGQFKALYNPKQLKHEIATWMDQCVERTWQYKLESLAEKMCLRTLRERAEKEAIDVFSGNVKDVLMSPPAGPRATLGIDPGLRTGAKLAVIDATGQVKHHTTIFPHAPQNAWSKSKRTIKQLITMGRVELIALGHGTGSRETNKLIEEVLTEHPELQVEKVIVSESGASIYSASQYASQELPDLDVSIRGAVSIARRLQNPMAELIKIDPKAIGVGQYQHDVNQAQLTASLRSVIEDAVNQVGVDLNTASVALLQHVSGLNKTTAKNIVQFRDQIGGFSSRQELLNVPRLGKKSFEQAAGFLRIMSGEQPLDASTLHPEAYSLITRIASTHDIALQDVIAHPKLKDVHPEDYCDDSFNTQEITDILNQLSKRPQDPRGTFSYAQFQDHIIQIEDLKPDMLLEGVVSNVANFGAFVDIGLPQKGLIHISELADRFVDDPRKIIKTGDQVKVKVTQVDVERERINLSMRLQSKAESSNPSAPKKALKQVMPHRQKKQKDPSKGKNNVSNLKNEAMASAFADAFAKLKS
tara:strand:+ start:6255 stop:8582 length:2328 start_codon:yes stop_codon:yes gene_type:complete